MVLIYRAQQTNCLKPAIATTQGSKAFGSPHACKFRGLQISFAMLGCSKILVLRLGRTIYCLLVPGNSKKLASVIHQTCLTLQAEP